KDKTKGKFVLICSQNQLLQEKISQTLTGRYAIANMLPLSMIEISNLENFTPDDYEEILFRGFYPAVYGEDIDPEDFFSLYFETLVNRDVRQIQNIRHLTVFTHFLKLCAGRTGQILDYSSLARDAGISVNTAKEWISILVAGYVVFLLQPYHNNFGKRLIKTPKLYFYDTGLLSYLLNIRNKAQLNTHYLKGNIFENFVLLELLKYRFNQGLPSNIYFWRDNSRNEIDCLVDGTIPEAIEIKSGKTFTKDSIKQVHFWKRLTGYDSNTFHVVYGGDDSFKFLTHVYSWRNLPKLFSNLQSF
ncbi:ATPase, partial [hydrothermal vent metagenome]